MLITGLFIKMSNGATYAIVPFVNKRALGAVAGIVGAGGNVGAVLGGFSVSRPKSLTWPQALLILGRPVTARRPALSFDSYRQGAAQEPLGIPVPSSAAGD